MTPKSTTATMKVMTTMNDQDPAAKALALVQSMVEWELQYYSFPVDDHDRGYAAGLNTVIKDLLRLRLTLTKDGVSIDEITADWTAWTAKIKAERGE